MSLPLMANRLARAIVLGPTCAGRILAAEPFLQLIRAHVDELIELPVNASVRLSSNQPLLCQKLCTHLMTVSLSLT